MEIIYVLLPIALALAFFFLGAYLWAVRAGQFDDTTTPAYRILLEDEEEKREETRGEKEVRGKKSEVRAKAKRET